MGNELAPGRNPASVLEILNSDSMKHEWGRVLPSVLTPERMARVAISQVRRVPKLLECTQASLLSALMTCAELGLEPNGRHAHLIPYGKECTLIIDFKGLAELAMRSGKISRLHADVVCANDGISIENGIISHKINPLMDRGDMIGSYAICTFKDGTEKHEFMSKKEVDAIRSRSKAGRSGPWVTDYNEMAKKTAFRRMSKWLPLSPEVHDTLNKEGDVLDPNSLPNRMAADIVVESPIESGALLNQAEKEDEVAEAKDVPGAKNNDGVVTPTQDQGESKAKPIPDVDVSKLNKVQCVAAVSVHKDAPYYAPVLDEELGEGIDPKACAVSVLREVLAVLIKEQEKLETA